MRLLAAIIAMVLVVTWSNVSAEKTGNLKVSATIPPRPCVYDEDDDCERDNRLLKLTVTRVVIDGERILYVGSSPTVKKEDGVTLVLF